MEERERVLNKMRALCSRSEHCRSDIRKRLEKYVNLDAEEIVEILCKEQFINDLRYAVAFARDKSSLQGWGERKIKLALARNGVEESVIKEALEEIDEVAADKKLDALLRTKYRSLRSETMRKNSTTDDQEEYTLKMKIFRYALSRGYSYDQIEKLYDTIRSN